MATPPPAPYNLERTIPSLPIQERRLVIALDYGTTYTGIAYATPVGDRFTLSEIDVNGNWGLGQANHQKVPSVISYSDPSDSGEQQWGLSLSPDAIAMVHTKLELDFQTVYGELDLILESLDGMKNLNFAHVKASGGDPPYTYKSAEQIVTDYLTKVFEFLLQAVKKMTKTLRDTIPTDIAVTIPTGWSPKAMNSTYRALTQAGFNQTTFPRLKDIIFVTEPEAAAIFTAREEKLAMGREYLKERECFILCDCGGGTVDVVSYRVKRLQPNLELEQIGLPTGRKAGSIFIDRQFKHWLRGLIGDGNYQLLDPNAQQNKIGSHSTEGRAMRTLMKDFETLKRTFSKDKSDMHMELPYPLENLTIPGRVEGGEFTVTNKTMCAFFNVCIAQVFELVKGHIDQIDRAGARTKNIFLVGGFGASVYLREELDRTFRLRHIQLRKPEKSWTAVVRGAVICGIEKNTTQNLIKATPCRHSYGVSVSLLYSDVYHSQRDRVVDDVTKLSLASEQLLWLLNKGDLVRSNAPLKGEQEITISFNKIEPRKGTVTIYMYSDDTFRPESLRNSRDELTTAQIMQYDLTTVPLEKFESRRGPDRKTVYYAVLNLKMALEGESLGAEIWWKDTLLSKVGNIMY